MSIDPSHPDSGTTIRVYGHSACPMVPPVLNVLSNSNVSYEYINIHKDEDGKARVMQINNGYASVPTLVFPDGSTLTEPSTSALCEKLTMMGHNVPVSVRLVSTVMANIPLIIVGFVVLYVLIDVLL